MSNFWNFLVKIITAYLLVSSMILPSGIIEKNTTMKITVNPKKESQTIEGWGTSACWWSQNVSDPAVRTKLAKLLYSKEGLGLNIYRYNVGGGVNPEHNRVSNPWRNAESFYYYNESSGKYEYDFTRDANAQAFLDEALKYGCIDTVVLFANSPHYSMTISGEASGSYESGGKTNLAKEHYQDFVDYFLTITEYFIDKGAPVKYISPINEPQWDWGGEWVGQEGCHYEPDQIHELLALFSKGIDERGLDVKLSCPESGSIGDTTEGYFDSIASDPELFKNVGTFAYHSYWSDENVRRKKNFGKWLSKEPYASTAIEMSEWCELPLAYDVDDARSATRIARVISNDVKYTGVNSWTSWVAVNQYGVGEDGLKYSDGLLWASDDFSEYDIASRYYAYAHYSKFVPVGSVVIDSRSNKNGLHAYFYNATESGVDAYLKTNFCAFKTPEGKIVVVVVNEDEAKDVKFNVDGELKEVYTTDSERKLEKTFDSEIDGSLNASGCSVKINVTKNSVSTLIFE